MKVRLTSFGCQTQICVRRRGLPTVGLGRWKGISLIFQRGWGSWWVSIGIGIFIEGNPARRRWRNIKQSCAKGLDGRQHDPNPGKYWGRASTHFLGEEPVWGQRQPTAVQPFIILQRNNLSALKQLISQVKKQKSMKWRTKGIKNIKRRNKKKKKYMTENIFK